MMGKAESFIRYKRGKPMDWEPNVDGEDHFMDHNHNSFVLLGGI